MAHETNLVAISWTQGRYSVVSQQAGAVDADRIAGEGLFRDVADLASGYDDTVAVLTPRDLYSYAMTDATKKWLDELPTDVLVVLVHKGEWESGLGD